MSFIDRIEGPGETQDLPEIKKISLSRAEVKNYLDRKEPKVAELLNKMAELEDIENSSLWVDEAEKLLDDKRTKETGGFTEFRTKQNLELFNKVMEREKGPGWEKNANLPELDFVEGFSAEMTAEKINEMLAAEPMWKSIWMDEAPEHLIAKWEQVPHRLVGRKLRHSRANLEKTLAKRKGRYSKE